jgi:hypothetical protein
MAVPAFPRLLFTLLILLCIALPPVANAEDQSYLQQLIQSARQQHLQQRPEWHKLLHYKPGLLPGSFKSQVDAPDFFFANDGKTDPGAELEATLAAFFKPFPADPEDRHLHAQCRFIARYTWLKQQLGFDAARLPEHECKRFEEWMTALNPQGVTLIFPTAYINSPASMFGHTLLRVDARGQNEQTRLLAYAINFGANTGNDGGLLFAMKGLLGGYPGYFSVLPYYLKVREYSDMENRDIWEYHLNLTPAETHTMLLHAWEMRGIWFDYYFFDENCSYHLLSLIETARPDLELTDHFGAWAIPSDTVRVVEKTGLVDKVVYRPSRHSVLQYRMTGLPEKEIDAIRSLAKDEIMPDDHAITHMPVKQQAEVLELAHEYADYRHDDNAQQLHRLLQARSELGVVRPRISVPPGTRPDQGHATGRTSFIAGREDGHDYQELQLRPAYHDLLDPAPGYSRGAQIAFFDLGLRHNDQTGNTRLQYFTPVNIISLTPVSDISTPISWEFNFGLTRKHGQQHDRMLATVNGGVGLSWSPLTDTTVYGLIHVGLDAGDELRKGYAAGTGGAVGLLAQMTPRWSLHLFARDTDYTAGEVHNEKRLGLEQRYTLNKANTLRMEWTRQRQLGNDFSNFNLSWQHFM